MPDLSPDAFDAVLQERHTLKVFADPPLPAESHRDLIESLIAPAAWAPFHRPAHAAHRAGDAPNRAALPWRFYPLDAPDCRTLRQNLIDAGDTTKIPPMLGAADAVIFATWLPNPPRRALTEGEDFDPTLENAEHLAAASCAVQNLLLAATARGLPSYWSTGGMLRQPEALAALTIPPAEPLLGLIFIFPPDSATRDDVTAVPGKQRNQPRDLPMWTRWIELGDRPTS
ncbi:MAG: nitroreductase family protein [Planctomycetota bacterium]